MKSFSYKQQKAVTFGLIDEKNIFSKDITKNFTIKYDSENIDIAIEDDKIYNENLEELNNISLYLDSLLNIIFQKESYHRFSFSYKFSLLERKKLQTGKISEKGLKEKIWKKYESQYKNYLNNINIFSSFLEEQEESLSRLSHIVRTIRYIKGGLEKISHCLKEYSYHGENEQKKKALKNVEKFLFDNKNNFFQLLNYYSKLDKEQVEEYKIALNPAILNSHSEINQANWEGNLKILKTELKELEKQNDENKKNKRLFEEELEAYINYILYQNNFFKESKNQKYKEKTKKIYEKYSNLSDSDDFSENLVIDFIKRNQVNLEDPYEVTYEELCKYLEQQECMDNLNKLKSNINFLQLKTFLYQLMWKRAEIKENNKKSEEKQDYQKLSEYITIIKGEINSRLKNTDCLYGKFIKPDGIKAKTAQMLGQKYGEYTQKFNFDKELKGYTHFGFVVRKGNRFFIKSHKKEDVLNENQGFTLKDAEKLIQDNIDQNGEYEAFIFQSLMLKGLLKLIFIKNAFSLDFIEEHKEIYKIWKEKQYTRNEGKHKNQYKKMIPFLIDIINSKKGKELFPYIKNNFKESNKYISFQEFEKDLLRNSYSLTKYKCSFNEEELIELDIVDRKFEFDNTKEPRLKRQNDIHLFVEGFFDKQDFNFIRLLPEIKVFIRYQKFLGEMKKRVVSGMDCNGDKYEKEIGEKERFHKTISKVSFMLELNPCEIGGNPQKEREKFQKNLLEGYKTKEKFHIISIDIGENSFATLGVYDQNLIPQPINIEGLGEKYIIDITDLQIEKGKIIQKNTKNSKKYKSYKEIFNQIVLSQIYLKDILEKIGIIELSNNNYSIIQQKISENVDKISDLRFETQSIEDTVKNQFPLLKTGLKTFLFNYIKNLYNGEDRSINISDYYDDIFKKLELQKVINFKDAFGSNFVGIIQEIFKKYLGIIVFESLHTGDNYDSYNDIIKKKIQNSSSEKSKEFKTFGTYVGMYITKSLIQKFSKIIDIENLKVDQWIYFDKNYENTIGKEKYSNNGILFFVDEKNTSRICPKCNQKLNRSKQNGDDHLFHNDNNPAGPECIENPFEIKKSEGKKGEYNGIQFSDGDDLATYNIAKKVKEYLESLSKKQIQNDHEKSQEI